MSDIWVCGLAGLLVPIYVGGDLGCGRGGAPHRQCESRTGLTRGVQWFVLLKADAAHGLSDGRRD